MPCRIWPIVVLAIVLPLENLLAQNIGAPDTLGVPKLPAVQDSSTVSSGIPFERVIAGRTDTLVSSFSPRKSTSLAMGLSALLPGAGQVYNGSYWKVPVIVGLGIYFVSYWLDNNRRYLDNRDQYAASITATAPSGDKHLLAVREFYKDERDTFMWYFLILYFANIADAYVDASLYDFNVGDDLSVRLLPGWSPVAGINTQLQLRITF
jgi:hypothetical protein